jgi:hypothetical protein
MEVLDLSRTCALPALGDGSRISLSRTHSECMCVFLRWLPAAAEFYFSYNARAKGFLASWGEAVQSGVRARDANATRSARILTRPAHYRLASTRLNFSGRAHTLISISINFVERARFNLWMYKIKLPEMNIFIPSTENGKLWLWGRL